MVLDHGDSPPMEKRRSPRNEGSSLEWPGCMSAPDRHCNHTGDKQSRLQKTSAMPLDVRTKHSSDRASYVCRTGCELQKRTLVFHIT